VVFGKTDANIAKGAAEWLLYAGLGHKFMSRKSLGGHKSAWALAHAAQIWS
jgi:hypothetical protein